MKQSSQTILIVDDEEKIVDVVRSYLESSGYDVFEAYNGNDALDIFDKTSPSLVILDLMLPDLSGEEICKIIRKKSRVPIIMLTAKVQEESILKGFNIGADDYVTKPFSTRQLLARVTALLRRTSNESSVLSNIVTFNNNELSIDFLKYEVKRNDEIINLTPNEYKILALMVKYSLKTFTREELIYLALGEDYEGNDRTMDTYIKNLRQKIEVDTKNPRYILTVHGVGYRFGGE